MVGLGFLPGYAASWANDVSDDGLVVVGRSTQYYYGVVQAFRWTAATGMVGLGHLPGGWFSSALGTSAFGSVVVGSCDDRACIWDSAHGWRPIQDILADSGVDLTGWNLVSAFAVSADNLTVVGSGTDPEGRIHAWMAVVAEHCSNMLDDDGDGLADYPEDPGC
jgi:probable HAF family extracellular repeat protein